MMECQDSAEEHSTWERDEKKVQVSSHSPGQVRAANDSPESQDKMWNENWKILRGAEVWSAAKFANPQVEMTVKAWTNRDGKQENTIGEEEAII